MAVYKKIIGNELYVYMNGELLYKRWLNEDKGIVISSTKPSLSRAQGSFRANDVFQHVKFKLNNP